MSKNKGLRKTVLRLFIAAMASTLVGLGGYKIKTLTPISVNVTCVHIYSEQLRQEVAQFVTTYVAQAKTLDPVVLSQKVKERFTFVKAVSWTWSPSGDAIVMVEGVKPWFWVNNQFVLGNKRRLFARELFCDLCVDSLRPLTVALPASGEKVPKDIYKFLQSIPECFWDRYTVNYSGDHAVLFEERNDGSVQRFVVDKNSLFDWHTINLVQFVHDDFVSKRCRRYGRCYRHQATREVAYDLRFKNRVCARLMKH